jgi:tRNA(fMet)-specific endonuclease VapC
MKYLVDSDWVIDYLKGRPNALSLLEGFFDEGLAISIITFAEIYEGIYYSRDPKHNEIIFRRFLRGVNVLGINRPIAREFAIIRGDLRAKGQLIGQPDILIAATAIYHDLTLLTRNIKDYQRIPKLKAQFPIPQ